jgi:outer membrane lipoprotein carrier protein
MVTSQMKSFFLVLLTMCFAMQSQAQLRDTNDPAATKLLDKLSKKYEAYKSVDIDFQLAVEVPGEKSQNQKGKISQAKEAYRLTLPDQTIISDGKTNWIYLKKSNEVQISDTQSGDKDAMLTPRQLLQRYKTGDFIYAVTDKVTEGGVVLTQIEFKPVDKGSEYSKIRLSLNDKTGLMTNIKAFAKDGSRYTFTITKHNTAAKHDAAYYTYDKSQFPNARIEDLRM